MNFKCINVKSDILNLFSYPSCFLSSSCKSSNSCMAKKGQFRSNMYNSNTGYIVQSWIPNSCRKRGIHVVSEAWLIDSIKKQEAQPLEAYDLVTDLAPDSEGIPWYKMDPSEEAIESIAAEVSVIYLVLCKETISKLN